MFLELFSATQFMTVGRSDNPGEQVVMWWVLSAPPPLVAIGLTDLPKSRGAPPAPTGLHFIVGYLCFSLAELQQVRD